MVLSSNSIWQKNPRYNLGLLVILYLSTSKLGDKPYINDIINEIKNRELAKGYKEDIALLHNYSMGKGLIFGIILFI